MFFFIFLLLYNEAVLLSRYEFFKIYLLYNNQIQKYDILSFYLNLNRDKCFNFKLIS